MTSAFAEGLAQYGLEADDMATIERVLGHEVTHFTPGQRLVDKGDMPVCAYLILEGWACRYKVLPNRRRQIIAFLLPGDMSDLQMFFKRRADHSIACLTNLTVARIPPQAFNVFFDGSHPRIAQALWSKTFQAACIQREWIVNLGQRSAPERIGHILCELYYRLEAAGLTNGTQCPLPLTQTDLADATGLSLVHVNKRLQDLKTAGLVALRGKTLTIMDLNTLQKVSFFNPDYLQTFDDPSYEPIPWIAEPAGKAS